MFASSGPGHTAASSSDHPAAATESILHLTPRLASLDSGGALSSAGYSTSTNLRPDRVCAPRGVPIAPSGIRLFRWNPQGRGRISVTLGGIGSASTVGAVAYCPVAAPPARCARSASPALQSPACLPRQPHPAAARALTRRVGLADTGSSGGVSGPPAARPHPTRRARHRRRSEKTRGGGHVSVRRG